MFTSECSAMEVEPSEMGSLSRSLQGRSIARKEAMREDWKKSKWFETPCHKVDVAIYLDDSCMSLARAFYFFAMHPKPFSWAAS